MPAGPAVPRYARALLDAARAEGALEAVGADVSTLAVALAAPSAKEFLSDPVAAREEKLRVLSAPLSAGGHPVTRGFLATVLAHRRESELAAMLAAFDSLKDAAEGRIRATLTTARAFKRPAAQALEGGLAKRLGKGLRLETRVDPALLAGATLRVGDTLYDASARSALERLGRILAEARPPKPRAVPKPAPTAKAKAKTKSKSKAAAPSKRPAGKAPAPAPQAKAKAPAAPAAKAATKAAPKAAVAKPRTAAPKAAVKPAPAAAKAPRKP